MALNRFHDYFVVNEDQNCHQNQLKTWAEPRGNTYFQLNNTQKRESTKQQPL